MTKGVMHAFTDSSLDQIAATAPEPESLADARRAALKAFAELPGPIVDAEAWKQTRLDDFDLDAFTPAVERIGIEGADEIRAAGGLVAPLRDAIADPRVAAAFERVGFADSDAYFWQLALAFHREAIVVVAPRGVAIETPLVLERSIEAAGDAIFPLTLILAEEASQLTVIDRAASTPIGGAGALAVHAAWIDAGPASHVTFLGIQDYAQDVWHLAPTRAIAGRDATVRTLSATIGGVFSRSHTEAILAGAGSSGELLGCYFGDHEQRVDHRTLQLHAAPNTSSDLYYKGALKGRAQAVYSGLVKIEHEATDCDAQQKNRNLLLSPHASADASPFLEILTSEVQRATHGVSVGRPDADVLFYLRSRGIEADVAQRLYVKGFFQEIIDRVRVERVRAVLEDIVEAELALEDDDA